MIWITAGSENESISSDHKISEYNSGVMFLDLIFIHY